MFAVNYLARRLRKMPKAINIAGNKDKRGITTQRATILRCDPELLIRQQRCKDWDPKIKVGSFERVHNPILLGQLKGNRFSIALRFVPNSIPDSQIKAQLQQVKENGFINYFGM